eukprot:5933405-Pyramimonas_sp.AAC.1
MVVLTIKVSRESRTPGSCISNDGSPIAYFWLFLFPGPSGVFSVLPQLFRIASLVDTIFQFIPVKHILSYISDIGEVKEKGGSPNKDAAQLPS